MSPPIEAGAHVVCFDKDLIEVDYYLPDHAGSIKVIHKAPPGWTTAKAEKYIEAMMHAVQALDLGSILHP